MTTLAYGTVVKMKSILLVVALMTAAVVTSAAEDSQFHSEKLIKRQQHVTGSNILEETFSVRLDHFRAQDTRTVEFTYHRNMDFYYYGGPVYIYLKDGGDSSTRWIEEGLMVDIASQNYGALFTFDMRYLGVNHPTEDASFDNLQYMTPEQILHDLAQLITVIRERHVAFYSPIIVWGSGYGATIATWARKKYPHLITGAWSSSGVYEIALASLNMYDSVGYTFFRTDDYECRDTVQHALDTIDLLLWAGEGADVQERLNLCHPVDTNNQNAISFVFESIIRFINDYIEQFHLPGLTSMCADMRAIEDDALASFARWFNYVRGNDECLNFDYDTFIQINSNVSWNQPGTLSGRRQWFYMQCTQTGLFQITDEITWMPNRIELPYHIEQCQNVLGEEYVFDTIRLANAGLRSIFGSLDQHITNVIYTNGYLDPLMYNGIIYTYDNNSFAQNIEHVSKSADLTSMHSSDPTSLIEAKQRILDRITEWSDPWGIWLQNGVTPPEKKSNL